MDINDLTIRQVKEISDMVKGTGGCPGQRHGFEVGKKYFIRSVTHHYLGVVEEICDLCIILKKVAWIADDGRFNKALQGEWDKDSEHEPYPQDTPVQIFYGAILDASEWNHKLITLEK